MTREVLIRIIVTALIALILGCAYAIVVNHDSEQVDAEMPSGVLH